MSIIGSNALAGASGQSAGGGGGGGAGYQISRSVRLNSADTAHFSRTPSSAGNRKTWTWSGWVKRSGLGAYDFLFMAQTSSALKSSLAFWNSDIIRFKGDYNDGTARSFSVSTNAVFRDPAAWYHVVCRLDTTQATAADRIKIWVNGVEQTFSSATYPTQNSDIELNNNSAHLLGSQTSAPQNGLDGYLTEVHFVDGTALAATDFGELDSNNVWQPKQYSGAYGPTPVNYYDNSQTDLPDGNVYLGSQPVENIFDGSDTTYARINRGSNSQTVATFKWEPTGGYAGVTKLRIKYNYSQQYRINSGTWYNVNNNGGYQEIYNGSAFTLNTLEIRRSDASGSDYGIFVHAIEINDSLVTNIGSNGFYLNFSDNTSTTTIAEDSSGNDNDWTANNISVTDSDGTIYAEYTGSSNQYLRKSGQGVLPGSNGAFTIECHFYPHNTSVIGLFDGGAGQTSIMRNYPANTIAKQGGGSVSFAGDYTQNAWNHIAIVYTGSTGTDLLTVYVNGVSSGSSSGLNGFTPGSNFDIGTINAGGDGRFDGYIRNFRVTHSAVYTSAFTAPSHADNLTAITNTKLLVITTPGNGLTTDASVSNYTLTNNGSVSSVTLAAAAQTDSFIDTPTNYSVESGNAGGNYAVLNPLEYYGGTTTFTNGNLDVAITSAGSSGPYPAVRPTINPFNQGNSKFYAEVTIGSRTSQYQSVGANTQAHNMTGSGDIFVIWRSDGLITESGVSATRTGTGVSYADGDVIGIAYDNSNQSLYFYKNSTLVVTWVFTSIPDNFNIYTGTDGSTGTGNFTWNFGQRSFQYPPGGTGGPAATFKSLCTTNLPDPTIADPSTAMDATIYTGTGSSQSITGINHSPDFVWIKDRSVSWSHMLFDTVRGVYNSLHSDATSAEGSNVQYLTAFNSDGFTVGTNATVNSSGGDSYIAWTWDAGSSTVSNTDGTITSSVRANASAGFSIVSYTGNQTNGATVGHGLNATPSLLIGKNRDASESWLVAAKDSSNTWLAGQLNTTTQFYDLLTATTFRAQAWNNAAPTSSVFELGDDNGNWTNTLNNNQDYVVYCFAPVEGYSAFGSYSGTGSTTNSPFIFTGFRPRWVMIKRTDSSQHWYLLDSERVQYNPVAYPLHPDLGKSETDTTGGFVPAGYTIDFLSNGFKLKNIYYGMNTSSATYIYAAFAEHPFKTARAR